MARLRVGDRRHRVHRRSPRTVGAARRSAAGRRRRLVAGNRRAAAAGARRGSGLRLGRGDGARPGHRRRPHLHAEPPSPPARRGGAGRGQARDLREAAGARRRRRAASSSTPQPTRDSRRRCRSSTGTTRRCARRASASRSGETGALRLLHGTLSAGLAPAPRRRQLARGRAARRRLARVRRHRLALVRPRRVRLRPSHRPPVRADAHRGARANQRARASGVRIGGQRRRGAHRHDRGRCRRPVRDGRRGDRLGRREPGLGRAQEPALDRARRRRGGARLRPGAAGRALVRASRGRDDRAPRSRDAVAGGGALCIPSRRPPAGLRGLLRRVRGRLLRRVRSGSAVDGMPTFSDGLRAALITDAVLDFVPRGALGRRADAREPAVAT